MKQIEVTIEGDTPLLMHNVAMMGETKTVKKTTKSYDPKEEAEKIVYKNKKGELIIPSRCLKACILNASSWYKFGRISAKQLLAGCTRLEPFELILTDNKGKSMKKYEIDSRPVVVQRNRIIRHRPMIEGWTVNFTITYNEEMIGDTNMIRNIIEEAGTRVGLLDNRPQKYGENGTFKVTKFLPS